MLIIDTLTACLTASQKATKAMWDMHIANKLIEQQSAQIEYLASQLARLLTKIALSERDLAHAMQRIDELNDIIINQGKHNA